MKAAAVPFVPRADSMDFVPGAAGAAGVAASAPSLGVAAKPFVPGATSVNAAVFVPGAGAAANKTSIDAPEFVPAAAAFAEEEEEDEQVMLPEMGDLEALGFGEGEDSEGLAEGLESMALRSRQVARRDAPTAEMHGGRMYMFEPGAHQHHRHRPLPDTFRPTLPPGLQHLARRFMPEDLRARLQHHAYLEATQDDLVPSDHMPELPETLNNFHTLVYLESKPAESKEELPSLALGIRTTVVKGVGRADGDSCALRRVDHRQLPPTGPLLTAAKRVVDRWSALRDHPGIVPLRGVFVAREMHDAPALFFSHVFKPAAITLEQAHMRTHTSVPLVGRATEEGMWSYAVQLSSALRAAHAAGLVCRPGTLAPSKVLLIGSGRIALGAVGVLDVVGPAIADNAIARAMTGDIKAAGHLLLMLACGGTAAPSLEMCSMHFSADLTRLIGTMLEAGSHDGIKEVRQLTGLLGDHLWNEMDATRAFSDALHRDLAMELENGRLFRLMVKISMITERAESSHDPQWAETGDHYLLKLFRDWIFHRQTDTGGPCVDWGFVVEALNKLDAGLPEKIMLLSRDEMSMLVVSYREVKRCLDRVYNDLCARAALEARRAEAEAQAAASAHHQPGRGGRR